jgi:hypothetical protein
MNTEAYETNELRFTAGDVRRAASENVISVADPEWLFEWALNGWLPERSAGSGAAA